MDTPNTPTTTHTNTEADISTIKKSLARKEFMFQALQMMNQELVAVTAAEKAIGVAATYLWEMVPYAVVYYVIYDQKESKYKSIAHTKEMVSEAYLVSLYQKIVAEIQTTDPDGLGKILNTTAKPEMEILGVGTDENIVVEPGDGLTLPLTVGNKLVGGFHLSLLDGAALSKEDGDFVRVMVSAVLASLERINILLQSQESKVETLVHSLTDGVIMFDDKKNVALANPKAVAMTGLPSEGYHLNELFKLFPGVNLDELVEKALWSTTVGSVHIPEATLAKFYYELICTALKDLEGNVIGGSIILHDITHLKEVDKMKTEFVSLASHQLRTPLTSISWYLEILMDEATEKMEATQRQYIKEIQGSNERMIILVEELLNVSRLEAGRIRIEPKNVALKKFIADIVAEVEPLSKAKGCKVFFMTPDHEIPPVPIDHTLMWQVIHNLLTNAIRYSRTDGTGAITVTLATDNTEFYTVSVADNGIGIPQEVQSRIFEKFFRADNAKEMTAEGTGLGLYMAKQIIEASGGRMWFESTEGSGTTFFTTIPIAGMKEKEGDRTLTKSD